MVEGLEHGLPRRRRRLCPATLQWAACRPMRAPASAVSRVASSPQAMPCRSPANRRRPAMKGSSASRIDYGSGQIRIVWGPQDDHFQRARAAAPFTEVGLSCLQGSRSQWASASRARRSSTPSASTRVAQTSSPNGIGPGAIQGARRRPADRAFSRPTDRGRLPEDRHRGLGRPAEAGPPACRARRLHFAAVTVEEAEQLRRDQESRIPARPLRLHSRASAGQAIDLVRLYEENLIDGIVYERDHASR